MSKYSLVYLLSFSFILFNSATTQGLTLPSLPPIDESRNDPQLKAYLEQLRSVVRNRDGHALQKLIAPNILLTFGTPSGKPPEEILELANQSSPIWSELEDILQFGGTFLGPNQFCIPYVYTKFPEDINSFTHQVIVTPSVIARSMPDRNAPKVAKLEFAIVQTDPRTPEIVIGMDGSRWITIYLDKLTAYVPQETLRSPIGKRACFERHQTSWVMSHFVDGD